ncbi:MAG: PAS domain S-box protein [Eubacteriales bacterium]
MNEKRSESFSPFQHVHQTVIKIKDEDICSIPMEPDQTQEVSFDPGDLIPTGYITVNKQGIILAVDLIAAGLLGAAAESFVNLPVIQIIYYEDQDIYLHHFMKLLETGDFHSCELRMIKTDRTNFRILMQAAAVEESSGVNTVRLVMSGTAAHLEVQRALRSSEEKYRSITENIADVIWIYNLTQKRYTFFNSSVQQLFGYTADEAMALSMEESMPPAFCKIMYDQLSDTLGSFVMNPAVFQSYVNEIQQPCKNGDLIWVEVSTRYQYNSMREIEVLGLTRDISKRKNEVEGFLKTNIEMRCVTDFNENFHSINERFEKILGYRSTEIEGKNFYSFLHEEDIQKTQEAFGKGKDMHQAVAATNRFRSKDGSFRHIEWYLMFGSGKFAYYAGRDVTDRQKKEEMFNRLDCFFDMSPDLLSISKMDGCYIKVSPSWEKVLGYSQKEIEGMYLSQILNTEKMTCDEINRIQIEALSHGDNFTCLIRHKDGSDRSIEWRAYSYDGCIYSIGRDVTARIEHEKQIEFLSYHDVSTGLFNRRFLEEEIKRMDTARSLPISIIMGDINRLKLVNDAFGHEKGDELILKSAESIKASCRPEDLVARWGGDEFLIFLSKTSEAEAEKIVDRILSSTAGKHVNSIPVSIAFGISTKTSAAEDMSEVMRKAENVMYETKAVESERERKDIIDAISHTLYANNPYEEKHAKRVSVLCSKTALALGLNPDEVRKASLAGLLHDIGKVAVSEEILGKTSPLSDDEWKEVRQHPEIGYKVVGSSQEMIDISNAIRAHHERMDGKGYPKGLVRDEIPASARIIAIADSFDTMTGQSLYRQTRTREEAIAEIQRNKGTQFDPQIAEIFIEKVLKEVYGTVRPNQYCPYCGSSLDAAANFCWNCGRSQRK